MTGAVDTVEQERLIVELEQTIELFARQLTAAQDAGVPHGLILPRMLIAFRRSFGEPPPGFVLPGITP